MFKHIMQKLKNIKHHRENQRNQKNQRGQGKHLQKTSRIPTTQSNNTTFRPMSGLGDIGVVFVVFGILDVFVSFSLDLFVCFGFFGFPDGFYIFKCTLDFSKRLGRGCAPLLNKAFHFTRVSMYKRLPCIIDILV